MLKNKFCIFATNINDIILLKKIKIGLAGNKFSIQKYWQQISLNSSFEIVGSFDTTDEANFENFYHINPFNDFIKRTDAVFFCGNGHLNYFDLLQECIKNSKDLLVEKYPILSYNEWSILQKLNKEADVVFFISNVKGSTCQFVAAKNNANKPNFVRNKIQIPYQMSLNDLEFKQLVFENIDVVLRCVQSSIRKVSINKFFIFNQEPNQPDEIKISIAYDNASSSEIILSKLNNQIQQELTFYQKGKIIITDFNSLKIEELRLQNLSNASENLFENDVNSSLNQQVMQKLEKNIIYFDVIQKDLLNFVDCFTNRITPLVSIEESLEVVSVLQNLTYNYNEIFV